MNDNIFNGQQQSTRRICVSILEGWQRDLLRFKGDIADCCVIGEVDVRVLRKFQSCCRWPNTSFESVPDGFEIDFGSKVLPAGKR